MRQWLINIREEQKKTQEDVAGQVGITRQMIGMIENGNANPSVETAKGIANVLNIDWTKFYEDESCEKVI